MSLFKSLLIANRGEIAVRIARSARRLGIRTVAVYSDADAQAMHVAACDAAVHVGGGPARDSYLKGERILQCARDMGVDAVHPGYGFLSENAAFAADCAAQGVVFVGPPPAAIAAMGSKSASKLLMARAGVPLVPGYHGDAQDDAAFAREAQAIGWPVLVKASAGGGGKGMRIVRTAADLGEALSGARREARAAFGDDRLLLERYLEGARHVEVQVFADLHGHCVHLFERDCSLQRRHQKVLEEAPAPGLSPAEREQLGATAIAAARAVGYVGAGTVEFVFAAGEFYFIEMNTRLQVEHPVTEMITGLDLVEWQLRVAAGEPLPKLQQDISRSGHAIEVRICAEDAAAGFLPSVGRLDVLRMPPASAQVRVDTGVRQGDTISPFYDSMIAKLIVHAETRAAALRVMARALEEFAVIGPSSNLPLLRALLRQKRLGLGALDTGFIERELAQLLPAAERPPAQLMALVSALSGDAVTERDYSPWSRRDAWRMNLPARIEHRKVWRGKVVVWHSLVCRDGLEIELPDAARMQLQQLRIDDSAQQVTAEIDGRRIAAWFVRSADRISVCCDGSTEVFESEAPLQRTVGAGAGDGVVAATLPGVVTAVLVQVGDVVAADQPLLLLEAMKMEYTLRAPGAGRVSELRCAPGERVAEGVELIVLEPLPASASAIA